jgi:serine/threonine protein kinase
MRALLTSNRPNVWFQLGPQLGGGGFADVYRCLAIRYLVSEQLPPMALKILRDACDPEIFRRFVAEARILNGVRHPNLVPAVEINLEHSPPYYVMPLMKETLFERLSEFLRRGEVYRAKYAIEDVIIPVCRALEKLHSRQIFHLDVKPANIFFDGQGVAKLGDLGICHFPAIYFPGISLQVVGIGTEGYSAPETLRFGIGTPQSDVYSVGIVFYEMIMGFRPPINWWLRTDRRPSLLHPNSCHGYVDQVIARMIDPDPRRRYANISLVLRDLTTINRDYLPQLLAYVQPAPQFQTLDDALLSQLLNFGYGAPVQAPRLVDRIGPRHAQPPPLGLQPPPRFPRLADPAGLQPLGQQPPPRLPRRLGLLPPPPRLGQR